MVKEKNPDEMTQAEFNAWREDQEKKEGRKPYLEESPKLSIESEFKATAKWKGVDLTLKKRTIGIYEGDYLKRYGWDSSWIDKWDDLICARKDLERFARLDPKLRKGISSPKITKRLRRKLLISRDLRERARPFEKSGMSRNVMASHPKLIPIFKKLGDPPIMTLRHRKRILSDLFGKRPRYWPKKK